jgi:hypothetical protein
MAIFSLKEGGSKRFRRSTTGRFASYEILDRRVVSPVATTAPIPTVSGELVSPVEYSYWYGD